MIFNINDCDFKKIALKFLVQKQWKASRLLFFLLVLPNIFERKLTYIKIEYAFKAIRTSNLTSVGVRGENCVALVTEKRVPDKLIEPETCTNLHCITANIGVLTTGRQRNFKF